MISSDQEDSPADRPLSDRTNIETAGEHDGELLAKKREEGRERTRLCRERKKAAKQKGENPPGEHEDPLLAKRRADQRERTRLCRERKKAAKQNENNLPGGKENQPSDMQPNQGSRKHEGAPFVPALDDTQISTPVSRHIGLTSLSALTDPKLGEKENQQADLQPYPLLGSSRTIQRSRKRGFGHVISLETASEKFQNESTSRANKRDPSLNNGEPTPLSAVTNLAAHKNQADCTLFQTDLGTINGDDESWLHRNDHFAPRPYGGMQNDHDSSCAIWDHEIQNVLQTAMSQERNQGHGMAISDPVVQGEDHATPEDLQRAQWRIRTERSRKRKRGNQVNVADLQRNIEFQRKYRLRNTSQMKPQVTPSGNVNPSLDTVDHNHGIVGVYDSGIWVPDASENTGLDEENLETNKPIDDDIDEFFDDYEGRVFTRPDVQYKSYRVNGQRGRAEGRPDPYDYVYHNLPKKHLVLGHAPDCEHCGAKRFPGEGAAFCCREGMVRIHILEVPAEMRRLFTNQTDRDAKYFRKNIRYFNSHFSFTSMGVKLDRRYATAAGTGIYTFRIQGQIYHRLDQLSHGNYTARNMQLYIYDNEDDFAHRVKRSPHLDLGLIKLIVRILQGNPYVGVFRSLGSKPNLDEYRIELNTKIDVDHRRYNAPTASQVSAIWLEGSDPKKMFERSVMVCGVSDRPVYIKAYYGCYDPLAYPLFFPGGEAGWNEEILYQETKKKTKTGKKKKKKEDLHEEFPSAMDIDDEAEADDRTGGQGGDPESNKKYVSAREYYAYKIQIRHGEFNVLFYGGRLFQQWLVDMYIKVESMRLNWYSLPGHLQVNNSITPGVSPRSRVSRVTVRDANRHQKIIRADLYQGVLDTLATGEARASLSGKRIILPRSMTGCDRDVQRRFLDAMTLVQRYGKPDYFITMTCNPYWPEVIQELLPGQTPQDRPEVVARVYKAKLRDCENFLVKKQHFGEVAAYAHVTEFQKRGLPHEHF
ncbi:hypothetical protein EJB05_08675, partial [Eragrostis curvula]